MKTLWPSLSRGLETVQVHQSCASHGAVPQVTKGITGLAICRTFSNWGILAGVVPRTYVPRTYENTSRERVRERERDIYIYIYVCVCVCVYVYFSIYIYIHTHLSIYLSIYPSIYLYTHINLPGPFTYLQLSIYT